jgi:hypothetical protein
MREIKYLDWLPVVKATTGAKGVSPPVAAAKAQLSGAIVRYVLQSSLRHLNSWLT